MIAPRIPSERSGSRKTVSHVEYPIFVDQVREFFQPGGGLAKACRGEAFPYEPRPQQQEMAIAVAEAIRAGEHLAVEAGTGVGKSFAYLVPAIFWAVKTGCQVVVSTHTIALQEQLISKDLPFLATHLGVPFSAVLVKGRSNYLCWRRFRNARSSLGDLFDAGAKHVLDDIEKWALSSEDGSLQSLEPQPPEEIWDAICGEHGNCMGSKCKDYSRCFLKRARDAIRSAQILVVNHHLFFSELVLRGQGATFLPNYTVAILDEAHTVEEVATEHFGLRLSRGMFEHWLRRLYVPEKHKGVLKSLGATDLMRKVAELWGAVAELFDQVSAWSKIRYPEESYRIVPEPIPMGFGLRDEILGVCKGVECWAQKPGINRETKTELLAVARRGFDLAVGLECFFNQTLPDQVYWVEIEANRKLQTLLCSAPIEIGPVLEATLFRATDTVVLTSATLSVAGSLEFFVSRLGARDSRQLQLGSPFDYARQMHLYIARGLPDPNDEQKFAPAAAKAILHFVKMTNGNAFVLFTNARFMRRVAEQLGPEFEALNLPLLVQGQGMSRHRMLERFRRGDGCILFGLDSFWMGVDVRGPALSNVIITRLPFAVPDHPVVQARMERIRERGGDSFREYSLPDAVLKFRQGVGRLIRTRTDEGIVVVLDSRIVTKWYGRAFLESIPECPREIVLFSETGEVLQ